MPDFVFITYGNSQFDFQASVAEELAEGFRALGYRAIASGFGDKERLSRASAIIRESGISLVVAMNGAGFSREPGGYSEFRNSLGAPVAAVFIDHPAYHTERIAAPIDRLLATTPGRYDAAFIRQFIRTDIPTPTIRHGAVRPLPGVAKPWRERDIDVLVPSSLHGDPDAERAAWPHRYGFVAAVLLNGVVEVHNAEPTRPLQEAVTDIVGDRVTSFNEFLEYFHVVDHHLRARAKLHAVRALRDAGVRVTVCGPGWPDLGDGVTLIPSVPAVEAFALMGRAKLVANHLPPYYESHERPLQAALYGAAAGSPPSDWLETAMDGQAIILPPPPKDAAATIAAALASPDLAERAALGRAAVENGQLWMHRSGELARIVGLERLCR